MNELANQKYVYQKINGWKIYHLAAGMDDIVDMEVRRGRIRSFLSRIQYLFGRILFSLSRIHSLLSRIHSLLSRIWSFFDRCRSLLGRTLLAGTYCLVGSGSATLQLVDIVC